MATPVKPPAPKKCPDAPVKSNTIEITLSEQVHLLIREMEDKTQEVFDLIRRIADTLKERALDDELRENTFIRLTNLVWKIEDRLAEKIGLAYRADEELAISTVIPMYFNLIATLIILLNPIMDGLQSYYDIPRSLVMNVYNFALSIKEMLNYI